MVEFVPGVVVGAVVFGNGGGLLGGGGRTGVVEFVPGGVGVVVFGVVVFGVVLLGFVGFFGSFLTTSAPNSTSTSTLTFVRFSLVSVPVISVVAPLILASWLTTLVPLMVVLPPDSIVTTDPCCLSTSCTAKPAPAEAAFSPMAT